MEYAVILKQTIHSCCYVASLALSSSLWTNETLSCRVLPVKLV